MLARVVWPLAVAVAIIFPAAALAQPAKLDPEMKTPYLWRVILKVKPHPLLAGAFRDQLKRDLESALQPALGNLGTVEVIDLAAVPHEQWDPLWQQFNDKGFAALEAPRDLNVTKSHFLTVEYRDGLFMMEARQHDGFTGLSSGYAGFGTPIIRKGSTRAPEMVGRTAGIMLDRDFGLDGTIEPIVSNAKEVKVLVRGGHLGPIDGFVKKGDIFAVSSVQETRRPAPPVMRTATGKVIAPPAGSIPPRGLISRLRGYSLLRVIEVQPEGVLRCEAIYSTFTTIAPGLAGFRCMKLGTIESPLAVKMVSSDPNSAKTATLVSIQATEKGFEETDQEANRLELRDGAFRSMRQLSNLACITVSSGGGPKKRYPVPILSADPIPLPYDLSKGAEETAEFERIARATISHVVDARNAQAICFEETAKLIERRKNTEALRRALGGKKAAEDAARVIKDEVEHLKEAGIKVKEAQGKVNPDTSINSIQKQLASLDQFNKQLESHIALLEKVVARENDPSLAAKDLEAQSTQARIQVLLARGDVDEALNAYDKLVALMPMDASVKEARDKLKAEWQPKNPEHAKAREYLHKTWPAVASIADFKNSLGELDRNIEICKKNGDKYALRKLLTIFSAAAVKLNELQAATDPNEQKTLNDAKDAGEFLARKETEIHEFVK